MTRERVAQQRKRLETAWKTLEFAIDSQPGWVQHKAREGFAALLDVDTFLQELEAATPEVAA